MSGEAVDSRSSRITRIAWLLVFLLAVPLTGLAAARGLQARLPAALRWEARLQPRPADRLRLSRMTLQEYCATAAREPPRLCTTNVRLGRLAAGSTAAIAAGLAWIVVIAGAGRLARSNRLLLLRVFTPGLYLTAVFVTVLILVHAIILMSALYEVQLAFLNRIHYVIFLFVGLGAASGAFGVARNTFTVVKTMETSVIGRSVKREQAPMLWHAVEGTALRLGALPPDHIVVGLEPNFFVTEAEVATLDEQLRGRTLFCSLSLARILSKDEFVAILGHELAHFRGEDTKFSERFYPIYRGTAASLDSLDRAMGGVWGMLAVLPAIAVLGYFIEAFAVAEAELGRERELAADEAGASVTSPTIVATGLVKSHAFGHLFDEVCSSVVETVAQGQSMENISLVYTGLVAERAPVTWFEGIVEEHLSHPTDSHPSLAARLGALSIPLESVVPGALVVTPAEPASSFLPDGEAREREISRAYQESLAAFLRAAAERG